MPAASKYQVYAISVFKLKPKNLNSKFCFDQPKSLNLSNYNLVGKFPLKEFSTWQNQDANQLPAIAEALNWCAVGQNVKMKDHDILILHTRKKDRNTSSVIVGVVNPVDQLSEVLIRAGYSKEQYVLRPLKIKTSYGSLNLVILTAELGQKLAKTYQ